MLSERQVKKILDRALRAKRGEHLQVNFEAREAGNTRFANNGVTTNGDVEEVRVAVTASSGGRSATVSSNATDNAGLDALVARAEELAALAPVDPEFMPPLGPQSYPKVDARSKGTAKLDAKARVKVVEAAMADAKQRGLVAAGFMAHEQAVSAVANSEGLFAFQPSTRASLSTTCRTTDGTGSGRAVAVSHDIANVDGATVGAAAAQKAEMSANPAASKPGDYTVVLEAQAVYDLLSFLLWSMSARAAEEGRSWFSADGGGTKVGQSLFSSMITLRSDPGDKANPAAAFTGEGAPQAATTWVDKGKLVALPRSRFWAQKTGAAFVPSPSSLHLAGGSKRFLELLQAADKGILVTRFWYNRMLEPRTILATGLTRDGTFAIEGGAVAGAIKNLRYNDSPLTLLKNVVAMGEPQRVETRGNFVAVVPPMVVKGFHFESSSDAI